MIHILNYGIGNVTALSNFLYYAGFENAIIEEPSENLKRARAMILPGVGSFDEGINRLKEKGFAEFLEDELNREVAIIGVCLGMQLLLDSSEEGKQKGLGFIPGVSRKLSDDFALGRPNCGWREIAGLSKNEYIPIKTKAYFNHSYAVIAPENEYSTAVLESEKNICVAIQKERVFGFQFHPERSHKYGKEIFQNLFNKI
jgi:glutamine amidotransferase